MAIAAERKAVDLEDYNLLMLFTCSNSEVTLVDAQEYFQFWRALELRKWRKKLQEQEKQD